MTWLLTVLLLIPTVTSKSMRISDVEEISIEKRPFQVSLEYENHYQCSGAIISKQFVITAAHCFMMPEVVLVTVRAGSSNIMSGGVIFSAKGYSTHPQIDMINLSYDVGLIQIQGSFTYSAKIQRVPLALSLPEPGSTATLSGWGCGDVALCDPASAMGQVSVKVVDLATCASAWSAESLNITSANVCSESTCEAGAGAPLTDATGSLVAITIADGQCANHELPSLYTSVPEILTWLCDKTDDITGHRGGSDKGCQ